MNQETHEIALELLAMVRCYHLTYPYDEYEYKSAALIEKATKVLTWNPRRKKQ